MVSDLAATMRGQSPSIIAHTAGVNLEVMTMPRPEIKPCPFCGITNTCITKQTLDMDVDGSAVYRIQCRFCLVCGPWAGSENRAIDAWNKRCCEDKYSDQSIQTSNTCDNCNYAREVTLLDGSWITVCDGKSGEMVQVNADDICDD